MLTDVMARINSLLWSEASIFVIIGTAVVLTILSGFAQYRALQHAPRVLLGRYDREDDTGTISPFRALSAALSGTIGLGNIGGVALAIALGGPGAVFWMWVVALIGMAVKMIEVTLALMHRTTDSEGRSRGGPMWVAVGALSARGPRLSRLGRAMGIVFSLSLITATFTGGNLFQAWNVGEVTAEYFAVPTWACGLVLSVLVGFVIVGGITRIANVAGVLVPVMCILYVVAGLFVLLANAAEVPAMFELIFKSAFNATEATGAFLGGTAGAAFLYGMKRAVFSNEAGIGTSPIAHAAAKTSEPAREGLVAGLEPFIDTIVVCTFTALIILSTGVWNRAPDIDIQGSPKFSKTPAGWVLDTGELPVRLPDGDRVTAIVESTAVDSTGGRRQRIDGIVNVANGTTTVTWKPVALTLEPRLAEPGVYRNYVGASLTAFAFDQVLPGLGKWLITIAAWLFAFSTIIAWAYYGEQGIAFIAGERPIPLYRLFYTIAPFVATLGWVRSARDLDNLTGIGTGVMVLANLPIIWLFGYSAVRVYRDYVARLDAGEFD